MSGRFRRGLADFTCRSLQAALPPSLQDWGLAVRCETVGIPDDTKALLFALDSFCGLMPRAIAAHLLRPFATLICDDGLLASGSTAVRVYADAMRRHRVVGIACAIGAVALGIAYLAIAGAPTRYLATNVGALIVGLTALAVLGRCLVAGRLWGSFVIAAMASSLLATAWLGDKVDGATRWVSLGGLAVQPSLLLLPVMLVAFARTRNAVVTMAVIAAATAMAIQPDRAMAGMLAAGLAVLTVMRPDKHVTAAFAASVAGFFAALARGDTLQAGPYVDRILYSAFDVHLAAGAAVLGGSALLLVPAIVGWYRDPANRTTYAVFGTVWFAGIMAAAVGNYPTPVVGYGGSAIIGYTLSLAALPKLAGGHAGGDFRTRAAMNTTPLDWQLLAGLA